MQNRTIAYTDFAKLLNKKYSNLKCIVITLVENGAYGLDCINSEEFFIESEKVDVKSTVGAGDSFCAAFLSEYLKGKAIDCCLKYASKVAGFVASNYAAVPDYNAPLYNI